MAITVDDQPTTEGQVRSFFRVRLPGKDDHTESFIGKLSRAIAMAIWSFNQALVGVDNDAVPTTKTSDAGLGIWANAVGLPNGAGSYGPLVAEPASGGAGFCTGTNGTVFPSGALLYAPDGVTVVRLTTSVAVPGAPPGAGEVLGSFAAVTPGSVGNIDAGSVLAWQSPPTGADGTVTLTAPISGGLDIEVPRALLERIQFRMQRPPKGGAEVDYATWGQSVATVARAFPYPLRGGLGTVHLVILASGSGVGRLPSATLLQQVTNFIVGTTTQQGVKPTTVDGYLTLAPYTSPTGLVIRLRMVPSGAKYSFEWASGAIPMQVLSYTPSPTPQIVLTQPAPPALVAAVSALSNPTIQIYGTSPNPVPVQVTSINNTNTTLTLQNPLPNNFSPPVFGAEAIYPASPIVASYSATGWLGSSPAITLTAAAPASLVAAIRSGSSPRIQVFAASSGPIPIPVQVVGIDATNTILQLQNPLPPGWVPPTGGPAQESIYPVGPIAVPIATAILAYVDGLGPSRASGMVDPTDTWEDTCAIARLEQIALDQVDADGVTRFAFNVVTPARIGGVSVDRQATDTASGVELLWAAFILIVD